MAITIGGIAVDTMIMPPHISDKWRARNVEYSLDGSALEDRLGGTKKLIKLPFGVIPQTKWEKLKSVFSQKTINASGYIGGLNITGIYRLVDNELPTPVLYVDTTNEYMCQPFTVTIEEV